MPVEANGGINKQYYFNIALSKHLKLESNGNMSNLLSADRKVLLLPVREVGFCKIELSLSDDPTEMASQLIAFEKSQEYSEQPVS